MSSELSMQSSKREDFNSGGQKKLELRAGIPREGYGRLSGGTKTRDNAGELSGIFRRRKLGRKEIVMQS